MRMSISSTACRTIAAEILNLPKAALIAISEMETALSSRTFSVFSKTRVARLLSLCGDSTAKIRTAVSRSRRTSITTREEGFHFFVRHGLPPVRIEDLDLTLQCAQRPLFAGRLFRAHDIHHRHTPAADGHRLSALHRPNQFREFVLSVRH